MRPGQQNRRSRNRGNRKGPNPLSRNYESNGPDVKIRGNAQHIADKYAQLARDATASGDRVMAENYLQHAEHYNRIIATAQAQAGIQQSRERDDDDADDGEEIDTAASAAQQGGEPGGTGPQPVIDGVPAEVAYEENQIRTSDDSDDAEERRPRRGRGRRQQQDDDGDAPAEASGNDGGESESASKPRRARSSRSRGNGEDAGETAPTAEDGSAIGWLTAAGQD